jgi:hypothetical protein
MYLPIDDPGAGLRLNETTTVEAEGGPSAWVPITAFVCFLFAVALLFSIM